MSNKQKGAASALAITIFVIIILAIIGIGWWWHHDATSTTSSTDDASGMAVATSSTGYIVATTTTSSVSATPGIPSTGTEEKTVTYTTYERRPVASAYSGISGNVFHNGTYGFSMNVPAGYRSYVTYNGPSGLPGTAQFHFVAPGESQDAFVVNVFSKAQWNIIRTQENYAHENTPNIGEGDYLGENFTWIYSDIVYSHAAEAQGSLSGAVFY